VTVSESSLPEKGFFGSLFDSTFTHFITLKFLRVIYIILIVLIGLATLLVMVASIAQGGGYIVFGVIVVPIIGLLYLVMTRIGLEVIAVLFRIGQNTSTLVSFGPPQVAIPPPPPAVIEPAPAPKPRARKPRTPPTA
jgi:hypothetical protein